MKKVRFPKFDANITEGMVGKWLKAELDDVKRGEKLVELVTDKATFELEADCDGKLLRIVAPEKSHVPVGYIIAIIGDADEAVPDVSAENERIMREYQDLVVSMGEADAKSSSERRRVRATPAARRLARQAGVDLSEIPSRDGKQVITEEDVKVFLQRKEGG